MSDRQICEICGRSSRTGESVCVYCGSAFAPEEPASFIDFETEPKLADFGFKKADTTTNKFHEAEVLFLSSFESTAEVAEFGYKQENVRENEDAYYFPVGWVGCSGHLVTKSPLRLVSFGSYVGANAHIWAHYKGISMAPLGKDRRNTLRILSIRDVENTVRVLKSFVHPQWVDRELSLMQTPMPIQIEGIDLYFGIRDLLEAEMHEWFKFEVHQ